LVLGKKLGRSRKKKKQTQFFGESTGSTVHNSKEIKRGIKMSRKKTKGGQMWGFYFNWLSGGGV